MSCDNSIPLVEIVDQVRVALEADYIQKTAPRIDNGVFNEPVLRSPSVRGDIIFDAAARSALRTAVGANQDTPPTVSGSISGGSALTNLLIALDTAGVIINSTTT